MTTDAYSIIIILFIGIGFFALTVIAMTVLFGMATALSLKKSLTVALLVAFSVITPFAVHTARTTHDTQTQADSLTLPFDIQVSTLEDGNIEIVYKTQKPTVSFIEIVHDEDNENIYPTYKFEARTTHIIQLDKQKIGSKKVNIIIDGTKYPIALQ